MRWLLLLLSLLVAADGLKTSTNVTFNVFSRVNQVTLQLPQSPLVSVWWQNHVAPPPLN